MPLLRKVARLVQVLALPLCALLADCGDTTSDLVSRAAATTPKCSGNAECSADRPVCELQTGRCGGCADDAPCAPLRLRCEATSGACVECLANQDCPGPERKLCNTDSHRCVECLADGHCDTTAERCSLLLGICAPPCPPAGQSCPSSDPYCDTSVGFCVECLVDADCTDTAHPFCRASQCTQ